jgi:hypothetical protein
MRVVALVFLFLLLINRPLAAQTKTVKLTWSKSGSTIWVDAAGTAEVIKNIEVAISTPFTDLRLLNPGPPPVWTTKYLYTGVDAVSFDMPIPDLGGGPWIAWLRVINAGGVASKWAKSSEFTFQPLPPVGLKVAYTTAVITSPPPPPPDALPVTSFANLVAGQTLAGTVTLVANATDDKGVKQVQLFVDGVGRSNVEAVAPYEFLWDTREVPDGDHIFELTATDSIGQLGLSVKITAKIKNAVVTVPPVAENQAVLAWEAPATNVDGSPCLDLKGFRVLHGLSLGTCDSYLESINVGQVLTHTFEGLEPGLHFFTVQAVDTSGNISVCAPEVSKIIP